MGNIVVFMFSKTLRSIVDILFNQPWLIELFLDLNLYLIILLRHFEMMPCKPECSESNRQRNVVV